MEQPARVNDEEDGNRQVQERKPRGWKTMPYILANEAASKIATYGVTANLTIYMSDYFNMSLLTANNVTSIFNGFFQFAPLVGAFLSDSYLGQFRTIIYSSFVNLLGMALLTLSASVPGFKPPKCSTSDQELGNCVGASTFQHAILYMSLAFLAIGYGGTVPCSVPFGADQFDKTDEQHEKETKSYYNWYYALIAVAIFIAYTVIVYIQSEVSWPIGFGVPTGLMAFSIVIFFLGTKLYIYVAPEGSIFTNIAQVLVASILKRNLMLPYPDEVDQQEKELYDPPVSAGKYKLRLTKQFRFLNKAAIIREGDINQSGSPKNKWALCSIQSVEELKCLIRIIPVWFSGVLYFLVLTQLSNFTYLQGISMYHKLGPHFTIPPASIYAICYLALTLFIPLYSIILVPLASKITKIEGGITVLQRQGVGIFIIIIANVVGALVARKIQDSPLSSDGTSSLSVFWLTPQLVLIGVSGAFNDVGQIEFFNTQFPEHMSALSTAVFYASMAVANYLCTPMVNIVNSVTSKNGKRAWLNDNEILIGRLDLFYYVVAILGVVNLLQFLVSAYFYQYKNMNIDRELGESNYSEISSSGTR
ncbi:hypothetical protein LUZ61_017678 [Rhynchospora tenuis]|uniref:Peptide transporter n=1 Tax=Rhynchospora tenuis TaxID=198213 RepID=A0AAD5Z808_9POAL|nr:hypothetical protein LUZ61_017678 [Rhynchospora tenuis]